eukprot:6455315-Amphidinium_carterae.1
MHSASAASPATTRFPMTSCVTWTHKCCTKCARARRMQQESLPPLSFVPQSSVVQKTSAPSEGYWKGGST